MPFLSGWFQDSRILVLTVFTHSGNFSSLGTIAERGTFLRYRKLINNYGKGWVLITSPFSFLTHITSLIGRTFIFMYSFFHLLTVSLSPNSRNQFWTHSFHWISLIKNVYSVLYRRSGSAQHGFSSRYTNRRGLDSDSSEASSTWNPSLCLPWGLRQVDRISTISKLY